MVMREEYLNEIKRLQDEHDTVLEQFNNVSSINNNNKEIIDSLIHRLNGIEKEIDALYMLAKTNYKLIKIIGGVRV